MPIRRIFFACFIGILPVPAVSASWDASIKAVEAREKELWDLAKERGFRVND